MNHTASISSVITKSDFLNVKDRMFRDVANFQAELGAKPATGL